MAGPWIRRIAPLYIPLVFATIFSKGLSQGTVRSRSPIPVHHTMPVHNCASPNFLGVRMMFKIIKYRNHSGKIHMTIETDDQMAADFCRFFGTINKFVDLFNYRVRSAKNFDLYQKTAPHKLALLKKEFAEQLERFRSMPGTPVA